MLLPRGPSFVPHLVPPAKLPELGVMDWMMTCPATAEHSSHRRPRNKAGVFITLLQLGKVRMARAIECSYPIRTCYWCFSTQRGLASAYCAAAQRMCTFSFATHRSMTNNATQRAMFDGQP
jgi:hypothetical protein